LSQTKAEINTAVVDLCLPAYEKRLCSKLHIFFSEEHTLVPSLVISPTLQQTDRLKPISGFNATEF